MTTSVAQGETVSVLVVPMMMIFVEIMGAVPFDFDSGGWQNAWQKSTTNTPMIDQWGSLLFWPGSGALLAPVRAQSQAHKRRQLLRSRRALIALIIAEACRFRRRRRHHCHEGLSGPQWVLATKISNPMLRN